MVVYIQEEKFDHIIREFPQDVPDEELKWHWDEEDRIVKPIHPTNWMFQFDNELPFYIDKPIFIKKGRWHRLIKGVGKLKLQIFK